jgi:putative lipoprotein
MRIIDFVVVAMAAFLLAASPALAERITLTGDVTYREKIKLPEGGNLTVTLIDLSEPQRPGLAASAAIANPGKVPLTFTLNLDTDRLDATHDYALVAQIAAADGTVWFRNAEPYAIDPLAPVTPIVIIVNVIGADDAAAATNLPAEPTPPPAILGATWNATAIAGTPVVRGSVSSLSIGSDMRAGGRGGCNSWFAQAQVGEQTLMLSAVAATRMACIDDALTAQETAFFNALAQTRFWRLDGTTLTLLDAAGAELAMLEKSRF